jgi:hypothetical protein
MTDKFNKNKIYANTNKMFEEIEKPPLITVIKLKNRCTKVSKNIYINAPRPHIDEIVRPLDKDHRRIERLLCVKLYIIAHLLALMWLRMWKSVKK